MAIKTDISGERDVEIHLDHELHRAVQATLRRIRDRAPPRGRVTVRIRPKSADDRRER